MRKICEKYEKKKTLEDRYLQGEEKFPLPEYKIRALPKSLDLILDNRTLQKVSKSKIKNNVSLFTRRGVNQIPFNSFLCCLAQLKEISLKELVGRIIKHLTPEEYLDLNNGDIFKLFDKLKEFINK